jgi:hypothetical protein
LLRAVRALLNDDEIAMQVTHWYNCCAVSVRRSRFVAFLL